jgi:hypothetical protein
VAYSRHSATVTLTGAAVPIPLRVIAGDITLDEGWAPYIQATVTADLARGTEGIDPRAADVRVRLTVLSEYGEGGQVSDLTDLYPGPTIADITAATVGWTLADWTRRSFVPFLAGDVRAPTERTFDLGLRDIERDFREQTMTLRLESDEALIQDDALVEAGPYVMNVQSLRQAVNTVLARKGWALTTDETDDARIEPAASTWEPGQSGWDYLEPLVQPSGLRLWCDERRTWHLSRSETAEDSTLTLAEGVNLTEAGDTISRAGDWYSAVLVAYSWRNADGDEMTRYDAARTPGVPTRVLSLDYRTAYPGPGAAKAVLARSITRGRAMPVSAVSDYTATPGATVALRLPQTAPQRGILSSVTFDLSTHEMSLTSRDLIETS